MHKEILHTFFTKELQRSEARATRSAILEPGRSPAQALAELLRCRRLAAASWLPLCADAEWVRYDVELFSKDFKRRF